MRTDYLAFQCIVPAPITTYLRCKKCKRIAKKKGLFQQVGQKRRRPQQIAIGNTASQFVILCTSFFSVDEDRDKPEWSNSPFQRNELVGSKYVVTDVLGQGNNGVTYEATVSNGGKSALVALKALSFKAMNNWKALELFEREARTLRSLAHPAIPSYVDSFEVDKSSDRIFVLVQRKAPGVALQRLLDEGYRFTTAQVTATFRQLLEVLQYLSSLNPPVLHRDVKPSNVVLDLSTPGEFHLSLVDFGGVNSGVFSGAASGSVGSTMIGTFGYMAPEQFGGTTDVRSDLYAAGATILYMLTGRSPSSLPQKRLRIDVESVIPERERVKLGNVYTVMMKLLAPAPEDRYDSAADALQALLSLSSSEQTKAKSLGGDTSFIEVFANMRTSLTPEEAKSLEQAFAKIGTADNNGKTGPLQLLTGWAEKRLKRRKPAGSRVVLDRDRSNRLLRIIIPAKGLSVDAVSKGMFAVAWTGFVAFWTAGALSGGAPIVMSLFSIPFWAAGVKLAQATVDEVTGLTTLVVSFGGGEKEVFYFGISCKAAIGRASLVEGDSRDLTHASVEIQMYVNDRPVTELILHEGTRRHVLGIGLEQIEQEWLRDEINDFLNCRSRR